MSTTGLVDTKQRPGATKRRQYSEALKRQIVAETLEKEDELQGRAGASEDHAIAVRAFVNKETPEYLGR